MDTNQFYLDFKKEVKHIIHGLQSNEVSVSQALELHGALASKCRHNLMYLPVRDQDTYNSDLRDLLTTIRSHATQAKPKFKFSHRNLAAKVSKGGARSQTASQSVSLTSEDLIENLEDVFVSNPVNKSRKVKLANISKSVVVLDQVTYSTAEIDDISDSIILIYRVNGPVYINRVNNSILILACHQFRMHSSNHVTTFVSCDSRRPIIENCFNVEFGDFPSTSRYTGLTAWEGIDDFSDLSNEKSWERKDNDEVRIVLEGGLTKGDLPCMLSAVSR